MSLALHYYKHATHLHVLSYQLGRSTGQPLGRMSGVAKTRETLSPAPLGRDCGHLCYYAESVVTGQTIRA